MVPMVLPMGALAAPPTAPGDDGRVFATAAMCQIRAGW